MNRTYSVIVLRGTQVRRLVVSQSGVRLLLWIGLLALALGGLSLRDYVEVQQREVREVVAKAQAQRANVSGLRGRTKEVQELLSRWKGFQERIQASLPRRSRASSESPREDEELQEVLGTLQSQLDQMISSFPSDWPLQGRVVSGVGMRISPLTGKTEFHPGLDIADPVGTPVLASGDGVVEWVGERGGRGQTVIVNHGQEINTLYAHLSEILVKEGEHVRKGQRIALVGNSGRSTGPHLHYEVSVNGVLIDPRKGLIDPTPQE